MKAWSMSGSLGFVFLVFLGACSGPSPDMPSSFEGLVFDTIFELGKETGAAHEVFEGIWDVEVDSDRRLAVLDLGGPRVHLFDSDGGYISSLTEIGLEEGQIDRPSGIAWSDSGRLMLWDPGSSWVSIFEAGTETLAFKNRWRAFAFGETGFCSVGDRTYMSYLLNGKIIHELGADGPVRSFGEAPHVAGADELGPELQEIAVEELTPSELFCTRSGVIDVSFVQSMVRLHDERGVEVWSKAFEDFNPIVVYSDDGIGLGRRFDHVSGSHLLRSVVPWGDSMLLIQHEIRMHEIPEEGETEIFESRLLRLDNGAEIARTRSLPLILGAQGDRLYLVENIPWSKVTAVQID